MENELTPISLPPFVIKKIQQIKEPYYEYFIEQMPYKYEAINNIQNEKMKLAALIDLEKEARKLFNEYVDVYSYFLADFQDWVSANNTQNEHVDASFTEAYILFSNSGEVFRRLPDKLSIAIKQCKAKIELKSRTRLKNFVFGNSNQKEPTEIHKEFTNLFKSPFVAASFINLLKETEYVTESGEWKGNSNRRGELREAYRVLQALNLLTAGKIPLESLKIFYLRFGLKPEALGVNDAYISIKSLSSATKTKDYDLFLEVLTPWSKNLPPLPLPN